MSVNKSILEQIRKLQEYIFTAKANGKYAEAAEFIDELVAIKEKTGLDTYHDKVDRELLQRVITKSKDFSNLITLTQDRLEYYRRQDNRVEQIDLLITITGLCIQNASYPEAADYLERAGELLAAAKPEEITQYFDRRNTAASDERDEPQLSGDAIGAPVDDGIRLELIAQGSTARMTGEQFIELRKNEVKRLRQFIQG